MTWPPAIWTASIVVRRIDGGDRYVIVIGERRWRAALRGPGLPDLMCLVIDDPGDLETLHLRIAEDRIRVASSPLELCEMLVEIQPKMGWSEREMARELHLSHGPVPRACYMFRRLSRPAKDTAGRGRMKSSKLFQIAKLEEGAQRALAEKVVEEGLTCEETEELVRQHRAEAGLIPRANRRRWQHWRYYGADHSKLKVSIPPGQEKSTFLSTMIDALADLKARECDW